MDTRQGVSWGDIWHTCGVEAHCRKVEEADRRNVDGTREWCEVKVLEARHGPTGLRTAVAVDEAGLRAPYRTMVAAAGYVLGGSDALIATAVVLALRGSAAEGPAPMGVRTDGRTIDATTAFRNEGTLGLVLASQAEGPERTGDEWEWPVERILALAERSSRQEWWAAWPQCTVGHLHLREGAGSRPEAAMVYAAVHDHARLDSWRGERGQEGLEKVRKALRR